jgi:hypothetical protein
MREINGIKGKISPLSPISGLSPYLFSLVPGVAALCPCVSVSKISES